jgi:hypothetical protein
LFHSRPSKETFAQCSKPSPALRLRNVQLAANFAEARTSASGTDKARLCRRSLRQRRQYQSLRCEVSRDTHTEQMRRCIILVLPRRYGLRVLYACLLIARRTCIQCTYNRAAHNDTLRKSIIADEKPFIGGKWVGRKRFFIHRQATVGRLKIGPSSERMYSRLT